MRPSNVLVFLLALLVGAWGAGCGGDPASPERPVSAVATTTQVADMVRAAGGSRVAVRSLLRPGADPHGYEARPSDVRAIAEADLVLRSGGEVDEWLDEVIENAGGEATAITLIDRVEAIESRGELDPHWWQDPRNAVRAVTAMRDALVEADPDGRTVYERATTRYVERLKRLDREIARCVERVPPAQRKVVTTHDSLGYFARRYEIDVVGAVIASLSTQAQPSARDVDRLVDQVREERVLAIFPESAVDARLERAIAREAKVEVGDPLYADSLGPDGSTGETYVGALTADAAALVRGMSGGRVRCPSGA